MHIPAATLEIADPILTDPTGQPREHYSPAQRLALRLINDERDLPFIRLMSLISFVVIPAAVFLYLQESFNWWYVLPYYALVLGYLLGPFILMLHNTSHRKLFRPEYGWMGVIIPWFLGPFFGETPNSYYVHHVGMHHPENNLKDDISSTMRFRRDSIVDFFNYFGRFMTVGIIELATFMWKRRRFKLVRQLLAGELGYYAIVALLIYFRPEGAIAILVVPFIVARFGMMAGNWAQHAFIDATDPANNYRNSITCINSSYNRRCFNDGYHIGHHLKPTRHWTDMPGEFLENIYIYRREEAIIFQGIDYFYIWLQLMLKRYGSLADRYVDLRGGRERDEIVALLRARTRPIEEH